MIDKPTEQDIEEGLKLINADKNKNLVRYLFLESLNQPALLRKINSKQYQKYQSNLKSVKGQKNSRNFKGGGNNNRISDAFKAWGKADFFDTNTKEEKRKGKGGSEYNYPVKRYKLNMNPFFEHLNKKLPKNKKLTEGEREFIKFIFSFNESREIIVKYPKFFEGIISFFEKMFFHLSSYSPDSLSEHLLKLFFIEDRPNIRYLDKGEERIDNAIYKFIDILSGKIKSKIISNEELWKNSDMKRSIKLPPLDIIGDSFGDDWHKG